MEESSEIKTESTPSKRRSIRTKTPNIDLIHRQNMLSKGLITANVNRNNTKKRRTNSKKVTKKIDLQIKTENVEDDPTTCEWPNQTLVPHDTPTKKDELHGDNDPMIKPEPIDIPEHFIVTKNAGIMCIVDKAIKPVFFPTEAENSGLILFNSSSKKAVLKISYPKCFVILSGQFDVDGQGIFNSGDFIKAPAGSQLGIKYLGGGDGCGRIIFFKSQS